ncbi:MAG: DNA primase [Planctomycetales bacterium]|nr:DNA primase [Planctomycetales bacterium]
MSSSAAYDFREQVRQATDIVDLVGSYLALRRQGRLYLATCPWHDDTRPSLQVNPDRQSWRCWVCQVGGDCFSFMMKHEGVEFFESLKILAERAGIELPTTGRRAEPGSPEDKRTLLQAMAWAEEQFHRCLLQADEAEPAPRYLQERSISPDSVQAFRLGYAPPSWQWLVERARTTPYSEQVLEAAGLASRSSTSGRLCDRFRGRVMFSIRDTQARTIAFGGRILPETADDRSAKYVNSPETRLFSKSDNLYALDVVRDGVSRERHAVVVEGYTDAIMAHQVGLRNVVAVLGTALGLRHIQLLKRFVDRVTLVLDGDEAGQRRTNEVLELFVSQQMDLRIVTLPEGLDPCDFLLQQGAAAFEGFVTRADDALEHRIRVATRGIDVLNDLHASNRALEEILTTLSKAPVPTGPAAAAARLRQQQILSRLSRQFRVDEHELGLRLTSLRSSSKPAAPMSARPAVIPPAAGGAPAGRSAVDAASAAVSGQMSQRQCVVELDRWERDLFEILLHDPSLAVVAVDCVQPEFLRSASAMQLLTVYRELVEQGRGTDYASVMLAVDDATLKGLLVEMDEASQAKRVEDPEAVLREIANAFYLRDEDQRLRKQQTLLEQGALNEAEQIALLNALLEQRRDRQGISAPTEG